MTLPAAVIWAIVVLTVLLILVRPKRIPEAAWAVLGAVLLVIFRLISPQTALSAIAKGTDVYLFLTGMMILAELARREGLFDWVAAVAVNAAKGSTTKLFAIIYAVGTIVTVFLSNDATAVVLTPAVLAAVRKAKAKPLPYLLVCAFIANAASFVLPISNPANLVVYGSRMPPLATWFRSFGLPSLVSIGVTFGVLFLATLKNLGDIETHVDAVKLSPAGKLAGCGILGAAISLLFASAYNIDLGLPTFGAAVLAGIFVSLKDNKAAIGAVRDISWSVLPLVAGLFVLVEAVNKAGALTLSKAALQEAATLGTTGANLSAAFGVALLCNIANNLPVGLLAATAVHGVPIAMRNAVLIGVDLGPNLSASGSLATILWLVAVRRDGEDVSFWKFLGYGLLVMPPALALAVLASR